MEFKNQKIRIVYLYLIKQTNLLTYPSLLEAFLLSKKKKYKYEYFFFYFEITYNKDNNGFIIVVHFKRVE